MMERRRLLVDPARCTGCRLCELACSATHFGEFNPALSSIRVRMQIDHATFVPLVCLQCDRPDCVEACPAEALRVVERREHSVVTVDADKCTGCMLCADACPFGSIRDAANDMPVLCDLCGGEPACVSTCKFGALDYGSERSRWRDEVIACREALNQLDSPAARRAAIVDRSLGIREAR